MCWAGTAKQLCIWWMLCSIEFCFRKVLLEVCRSEVFQCYKQQVYANPPLISSRHELQSSSLHADAKYLRL
jgi:hypothetical protein